MAEAIKNIPHHCFNDHVNCGTWCDFSKNPDTYKHSNIGDGFKETALFESLKILFSKLAENTDNFFSGVSSNVNESLNTMIVSKALKSRMYGMSSSADIQFAAAINQKNYGEKYVPDLAQKLNLSPGTHTIRNTNKTYEKNKKKIFKNIATFFQKSPFIFKKEQD